MNTRKAIRWVHLASTVWFMLCTGYLFILALRQAGFNWLVIFSLSGHWALIITLLVSLYLYTIFRGPIKSHSMQKEHPLTSTTYYMAFYMFTPFLGAIAGILSMLGETRFGSILGGVSLGTIGATFLTWVLVDPVTGSVELLLPESRKHRLERLARVKLLKQLEKSKRERLLTRILEQEQENESRWQEVFSPDAARLARLLAADSVNFKAAEKEAIKIGTEAWRTGGLSCMKYLRNMAMDVFKQQYANNDLVDYVSAWWDGIGRWRNPSLLSE